MRTHLSGCCVVARAADQAFASRYSNNEVVGVISQRDLYKIQPPHKNEDGVWVYDLDAIDDFILQNVMILNPFTLSSENTLAEAIGL